MKRMLALSLICTALPFAVGCVTYPPSTGFTNADALGYGYKIEDFGSGQYISVYKGNSRTRSLNAFSYTMLAAYQYCSSQNKVAYVNSPEDFSKKETYTQVGSYSLPLYNPKGPTTYSTHVYSYPVTTQYPNYFSVFHCRQKFVFIEGLPDTESISRELVHNVTKDFRGGILLKAVEDKYNGKPFLNNDVLVKVGQTRVENVSEVLAALEKTKGTTARVEVIRDQKIKNLSVKLVDASAALKETADKVVPMLCEKVPAQEDEDDLGSQRPVAYPAICEPFIKKTAAQE